MASDLNKQFISVRDNFRHQHSPSFSDTLICFYSCRIWWTKEGADLGPHLLYHKQLNLQHQVCHISTFIKVRKCIYCTFLSVNVKYRYYFCFGTKRRYRRWEQKRTPESIVLILLKNKRGYNGIGLSNITHPPKA